MKNWDKYFLFPLLLCLISNSLLNSSVTHFNPHDFINSEANLILRFFDVLLSWLKTYTISYGYHLCFPRKWSYCIYTYNFLPSVCWQLNFKQDTWCLCWWCGVHPFKVPLCFSRFQNVLENVTWFMCRINVIICSVV